MPAAPWQVLVRIRRADLAPSLAEHREPTPQAAEAAPGSRDALRGSREVGSSSVAIRHQHAECALRGALLWSCSVSLYRCRASHQQGTSGAPSSVIGGGRCLPNRRARRGAKHRFVYILGLSCLRCITSCASGCMRSRPARARAGAHSSANTFVLIHRASTNCIRNTRLSAA